MLLALSSSVPSVMFLSLWMWQMGIMHIIFAPVLCHVLLMLCHTIFRPNKILTWFPIKHNFILGMVGCSYLFWIQIFYLRFWWVISLPLTFFNLLVTSIHIYLVQIPGDIDIPMISSLCQMIFKYKYII